MAVDRMTTAEAERYCGSGKGYFRVLRWAGKGPVYYRQHTRIYYLKPDLDNWRAERQALTRVDPAVTRLAPGSHPASDRSEADTVGSHSAA